MTKAILWDFDETLARRSGGWRHMLIDSLDAEAPGHGVTPEDVEPFLRRGFPWHDWERPHPELADPDRWWGSLGRVLQAALEQAGVTADLAGRAAARARTEYTRLDRWSLFPDTVAALERFRALGWRQLILSNHCPELPDLVAGLGIEPYFDFILTSAATGIEKPNPEMYALAISELGDPRPVWMIGDSPELDVAGPGRCGIPAVLVHRAADGLERARDLLTAVETIERASAGA